MAVIAWLFIWLLFERKYRRDVNIKIEMYEGEKQAILTFLERMGSSTTSLTSIEDVLSIILDFITTSLEAQSGAIFILDETDDTLTAKVVRGPFPLAHKSSSITFTRRRLLTDKLKKDKIKVGEGIIGLAAETGEPILISEAENDPRISDLKTDIVPLRSLMLAPLKNRDALLGVFVLANRQDNTRFLQQDMELLESLANQAAITVNLAKLYEALTETQRMEQELKLAYEFQSMLLPKEFPETDCLDIAVYNNPALEVSGDYYDFFWVDEYRIGFVIADVSGKGMPGALIMAMVRSVLRAESVGNVSPKEVLTRVNSRVLKDTKENVFITMTYGIIDLRTMKMKFVRAGHEPTVVLNERDNDYKLFTPEGIALGLVSDRMFDITKEVELELNPGDTAILYTDGVIEAINDRYEEYGKQRFLDVLKASISNTPDQIIDAIVADIDKFTEGIEQHDDITLLAIKIKDKLRVAQIA